MEPTNSTSLLDRLRENLFPLVHTQETSAQISPPLSFRDHKTAGMKKQVEVAHDLYEYVDRYLGRNYLYWFSRCRSAAWFARHKVTGEVRVISECCHLRWCPICADAKRGYISNNIQDFLKTRKYAKLMTLTLKHSDDYIDEQIDKLYSGFRALRRLDFFKKKVTGGIWFFQIKKSKDGLTWHPHLHCVLTGYYVNRRHISAAWEKITKDSCVTDIRMIKDIKSQSSHVARYASCPCNLADLDIDDRYAVYQAMHGRRICGTWGACRPVKLTPQKPDDADCWENIGSWTFVTNTINDIENSATIFNTWKNKELMPEKVTVYREELELSTGIPPPKPVEISQYVLDFYDS